MPALKKLFFAAAGVFSNLATPHSMVYAKEYDAMGDPEGAGQQFLQDKGKEDGVITLPSGLMYKVLQKGGGKVHPNEDTPCDCHYKGTLVNGEQFDSSYDRGEPTTFAPNQVIKGWTEAMQLMVEGDKWEMYIPYNLAYGEAGSPPKIPGKSTLVFQMEIMSVNGEGRTAVSCEPSTGDHCSEKEKTYVEKMQSKNNADLPKELDRLTNMEKTNQSSKNLTKKQRQWLQARVKILRKMMAKGDL